MRLTLIGSAVGVAMLAACSNSPTSPSAPSALSASRVAGQVQSITPPTLNVAGQVVATTSLTVVRRGATRIALSGLHVGEPVRVQAAQASHDTLMASEIDADSNEVEFRGTVDSVAAPKLWVNGRTVVTDSATYITRGEDMRITLADLMAGDTVKVEGAVQADSSVLAHRIEVGSEGEDNEHEADVELHGPIDSIVAPNLWVNGRTVVTDSTTRITAGEEMRITLADLKAGDTVRVEGAMQADSSVLARRIEVGSEAQNREHEADVELQGPIDSIAAPDLFVSGHKIVTDSATTIERGDMRITLSDLAVGDTVEVEAVLQPDSTLLARRIEVRHEGDFEWQGQAELHGVIDSIVPPDLFVAGKTVVTDSATVFIRAEHHVAFGDLQVADTVFVAGALQADSSLLARVVMVVTGRDGWKP